MKNNIFVFDSVIWKFLVYLENLGEYDSAFLITIFTILNQVFVMKTDHLNWDTL